MQRSARQAAQRSAAQHSTQHNVQRAAQYCTHESPWRHRHSIDHVVEYHRVPPSTAEYRRVPPSTAEYRIAGIELIVAVEYLNSKFGSKTDATLFGATLERPVALIHVRLCMLSVVCCTVHAARCITGASPVHRAFVQVRAAPQAFQPIMSVITYAAALARPHAKAE